MSRRGKLFKPKDEPSNCPECGARLKINYFSNCAEYDCSGCDYIKTIWEESKQKKKKGPSKPKPKSKDNILEEKDIRKINKVINSFYEKFAFIVLLFTGLRVSEFIHMRKNWVDFKNYYIVVPEKQKCNCNRCKSNRIKLREKDVDDLNDHQKTILDGYWVPKTASSARTLPIVPEAREVIDKFFKKHKAVLEVFPMPQYVNNTLNRLQRRSKIKIFPHSLRATFATMLAIDGFDAYKLTDMMGWASIDVAKSYILMSGAELSREVEDKWSRKQT